jgi:hypothetical protein
MLVRKTNPIDVDSVIDELQVHFGTKTLFTGNSWQVYPRAYKNPKKFDSRGYIPECYTSNGEYIEVFYDDNFDMSSFFVVGDNRQVNEGIVTVDLSLIVQSDIAQLFPLIPHRADEELNNAFVNMLEDFEGQISLTSIETGTDNVYREFVRDQVKFDDMSNCYVVRFNLKVSFESECNCNC